MDGAEYFTSINDVSKMLGVPAHTLRYWEKQFPTVVRPIAGAGGRRYYREQTVTRLKMIQDLLYNRGMTIAGVKKMIHSGDFTNAADSNVYKESDNAKSDAHIPEKIVDSEKNIQREISETMLDFSVAPERPTGRAGMDLTKVDLAIGLLEQARELLKP